MNHKIFTLIKMYSPNNKFFKKDRNSLLILASNLINNF